MVLGVLNSLGLVLQVIGQVFTTASKSAFITSLNTPLVPLVALRVYRTRPSKPQLVAVVLATLGLMLLTYPAGGARWNAGDLLHRRLRDHLRLHHRADRARARRATTRGR